MNSRVRSGPIPSNFDPRWSARDVDPLPPDALVKFQSLGRMSPALNYRYVLYSDGRLFHAAHSGQNTDARVLYDTPLPSTPTRTLASKVPARVEKELRKSRFLDEAPYHVDPQVEDGSIYVVTARLDGQVHEVIYEAYAPPLVQLLETVPAEK